MSTISITQPDVTLLMDIDGVIRSVSFSSGMKESAAESWVGRRWNETVAGSQHAAVERMINDARQTGVSAFNQLLQRFPSGRELPVEYTTLMLGGRAGLIAYGKNLQAVAEMQAQLSAAQKLLERDLWKMREFETRYRLLFEASDEAVLLVRAADLTIIEANPAAVRMLDGGRTSQDQVVGRDLLRNVPAQEARELKAYLARVRELGKATAISVRLGNDGPTSYVRASLVNAEAGPAYLLRLSAPAGTGARQIQSPVNETAILQAMPDGFIVTDGEGIVLDSNSAFLELIDAGSIAVVLGQRFAKWACAPGADWTVLAETVRRHGCVRLFATRLTGELGSERLVEISGASVGTSHQLRMGFIVRDISRRPGRHAPAAVKTASSEQIEQKIGRQALKSIIDDAIGALERDCIVAALRHASGNRKAAAQLLGLSRQTLYAKMRRYMLDLNKTGDTREDA